MAMITIDGRFEENVVCPYDKSHIVSKKRFQKHLLKCRPKYRNDPNCSKEICPFNESHIVDRRDLKLHMETCDSRKSLDNFVFRFDEPERPDAILPVQNMVVDDKDESWDEQVGSMSVLDEVKNSAENKDILRIKSKTERKAFMEEERRRKNEHNSKPWSNSANRKRAPQFSSWEEKKAWEQKNPNDRSPRLSDDCLSSRSPSLENERLSTTPRRGKEPRDLLRMEEDSPRRISPRRPQRDSLRMEDVPRRMAPYRQQPGGLQRVGNVERQATPRHQRQRSPLIEFVQREMEPPRQQSGDPRWLGKEGRGISPRSLLDDEREIAPRRLQTRDPEWFKDNERGMAPRRLQPLDPQWLEDEDRQMAPRLHQYQASPLLEYVQRDVEPRRKQPLDPQWREGKKKQFEPCQPPCDLREDTERQLAPRHHQPQASLLLEHVQMMDAEPRRKQPQDLQWRVNEERQIEPRREQNSQSFDYIQREMEPRRHQPQAFRRLQCSSREMELSRRPQDSQRLDYIPRERESQEPEWLEDFQREMEFRRKQPQVPQRQEDFQRRKTPFRQLLRDPEWLEDFQRELETYRQHFQASQRLKNVQMERDPCQLSQAPHSSEYAQMGRDPRREEDFKRMEYAPREIYPRHEQPQAPLRLENAHRGNDPRYPQDSQRMEYAPREMCPRRQQPQAPQRLEYAQREIDPRPQLPLALRSLEDAQRQLADWSSQRSAQTFDKPNPWGNRPRAPQEAIYVPEFTHLPAKRGRGSF